jgi:hypothetical protein
MLPQRLTSIAFLLCLSLLVLLDPANSLAPKTTPCTRTSKSDQPASFLISTRQALKTKRTSRFEANSNGSHVTNISNRHWHVWRTADRLEKEGLTISSSAPTTSSGLTLPNKEIIHQLTQTTVAILRQWIETWGDDNQLQGLLNKSTLLHEIEESIVALALLIEWMMNRDIETPITVVDVCCGKGVFSMLASYVFQGDQRVAKIIMLDKANNINWNHIGAANQEALGENRPRIETWGGCNLHETDELIDRLEYEALASQAPLALIGIHLCKNLSPTCVGIVNALGHEQCPFLCLAPCCLPRAVLTQSNKYEKHSNGIIEVSQRETPKERQDRRTAAQRRINSKKRGATPAVCILCQSPAHAVHQCRLLPLDEQERIGVFQAAAANTPCWKCGVVGHFKADCPSDQTSSLPALVKPSVSRLDVSKVLKTESPFETYCCLLSTTLQREQIKLVATGLASDASQHQDEGSNWNSERKSIYIVAT